MNRGRSKGFTLLELLVTITVAAIIISLGVPGFRSMIQNNRATTHTNDLVTALNLARSEAVRRASNVTVCSSTDGATCNGPNDWTGGWIVRSSGGDLIRAWPARSGGGAGSVITTDTSQVQFQARGSVAGEVDFAIRLPDCSGEQGRDVSVNVAGLISVQRVTCS